jgi:acyl-CoA synthetase (NDP forming)
MTERLAPSFAGLHEHMQRDLRAGPGGPGPAVLAMLEARRIALVGASERPGSFGERMVAEVARSPSRPSLHLVNPRYRQIAGHDCVPSLADLPEPVDLVLLAVPDAALESQLALAASRGDQAAVIFGNAWEEPGGPGGGARPSAGGQPDGAAGPVAPGGPVPLRGRLAAIARGAGMALCGAGCMGFVNVAHGLRVIGYAEPDPLPAGPVALVTHSGSVFSALLRTRRAIGYTLAVSSGQELVTPAAAYLEYALTLPETKVIALVLEAMREPARLRAALAAAAARDIPVVLVTVGGSAAGRTMVAAHSGALAAADGGWSALAAAYGVHRVGDLAELADTLELFGAGRRARWPSGGAAHGRRAGIATVHDSGLERAHTADLADAAGVPFAEIDPATTGRLAALLDPGLLPTNPLDVWGTGSGTEELFTGSLTTLAGDPAVAAVALAVDLAEELDGDQSYQLAARAAAAATELPVVVLASLPGAIDQAAAAGLRRDGIPVLEGTRTGLLALRHLLDHAAARDAGPASGTASASDTAPGAGPSTGAGQGAGLSSGARPGSGSAPDTASPVSAPGSLYDHGAFRGPGHPKSTVIMDDLSTPHDHGGFSTAGGAKHSVIMDGPGPLETGAALGLLREYGISTARALPAASEAEVLAAAAEIGYPVVLKTGEPAIAHKTEARGVILGLATPDALAAAYRELAARLGPRALVFETVPPGPELSLGLARDPGLGPLVVVAAGGTLVELLDDKAVALPPVSEAQAARLLSTLRASRLLDGVRGAPPASRDAVIRAITALSALAADLGDHLEALDINPLICGPSSAVAVDALVIPRS